MLQRGGKGCKIRCGLTDILGIPPIININIFSQQCWNSFVEWSSGINDVPMRFL